MRKEMEREREKKNKKKIKILKKNSSKESRNGNI